MTKRPDNNRPQIGQRREEAGTLRRRPLADVDRGLQPIVAFGRYRSIRGFGRRRRRSRDRDRCYNYRSPEEWTRLM